MKFSIPYYHDYISEQLADYLIEQSKPVAGVNGLIEVGLGGGLETPQSLNFLCELYGELEPELKKVLNQRILDRKFIDERVKACFEFNTTLKHDFLSSDYKTILGLEDAAGRIVIGPHSPNYCNALANKPIAAIPEFLQGPHVTLFGPPGSAKMAINAMNTYHRKLNGEPEVVAKLLSTHTSEPKWGADDEDSKTPLRSDLVSSAENLTKCFEKDLSFTENGKHYELAQDHLSVPIKRFPGLALPCTFLFYKNNPIPLHLYDFALHIFRNWNNPKALVFYVPKIENEEEAAYIHSMIFKAEAKIKKLHPEYVLGSVRLMIVLENPRAILRTHEIMDALYPYFVGASLGWHDYLGSTARLFKEDANYRIPVKADPDIVIKYIKASHNLLADVVGSRGGIKVGGMYGILPLDGNLESDSFQITIKGYIKDVVTQMKRNLTGFWVAHPDFVRLGLALVEGWKLYAEGKPELLTELVQKLLHPKHHDEILKFIAAPDMIGLDKIDPNYVRSLIVADIKESDFIANNHPEEIRYNVFQSLQYITDWLSGNGCVALPAHVHGTAVRVMDDLATAERSRWEVWHEIYHNRFSVEDFLKIAFEEYHFIRKDLSNADKIVQVKWTEDSAKWYPIALRLMIQLMTAKKPVEFATELLMPFTVESIRSSQDPLKTLMSVDSEKYKLDSYIERYMYYFEVCGSQRFATAMAKNAVLDAHQASDIILSFSKTEIIEAAHFHGNIGESRKTLDSFAAAEQAAVVSDTETLQKQGELYLQKFGMKFLISAQSKTGPELLKALNERLHNSEAQELNHAREALLQITLKRVAEKPIDQLQKKIEQLKQKYQVHDISLAITSRGHTQSLGSDAYFELASLSKTLASAFAIEYFTKKNIPLDSPASEKFKDVSLRHLMNHTALNLHYIKGYPLNENLPRVSELIDQLEVISEPGKKFHYSGGGFLLLEHIIETLEKKNIQEITQDYFKDITFTQQSLPGKKYATGYLDDQSEVPGTRLMFPAFAAGAMGTATGMAHFLNDLTKAYHSLAGVKNISHDTAVQMLLGTDKGCREFMGCDMGLGVFVAECGENKLAIHQGANEGFRALYIHCFDGPNTGDGFVLLCNADNKGVLFNAELAQEILKLLQISGIDFSQFKTDFDSKDIPQEHLVNMGYKNLIFNAFKPTLPNQIIVQGPMDPLASFNLLTQASVKKVSNQKFARSTNMISTHLPIFDPELFEKQGKTMDSWESARHNQYEFDEMLLDLPKPSQVKYVAISTKYHDGNQAEFVRILGLHNDSWIEILPQQQMTGHAYFKTTSASDKVFSSIKIEMYPDGGLSRVGLYAELPENEKLTFNMKKSERFTDAIPKTLKPLSIKYEATPADIEKNKQHRPFNLAGLAYGAKILSASNEHYSPAVQVISPFPPIHMFDGMESSRSRKKGHSENVVIQLAEESKIERIILDFKYFVNNNPLEVSIDGLSDGKWISLVGKTNVKAFAGNQKEFKINSSLKFSQLDVKTFPDGGINRISVY